MARLNQFYYTNYGKGYRLEASSIPVSGEADEITMAIQAQAGIWEYDPFPEGAEAVTWSERAGSYMGAMTVPCIRPGDTRPGFWSHVILPMDRGSESFMDCLSWPLDRYEKKVRLGQSLEDAGIRRKSYPMREICAKYGLYGSRLAGLILAALRSACGVGLPVILVHSEESEQTYNQSAREMMAVIYQLLPASMRTGISYQSMTDKAAPSLSFAFYRHKSGAQGFALEPDRPGTEETDSLALEMGMRLAGLFESDPELYSETVSRIWPEREDRFESMLWTFYRSLDPKTEIDGIPQDVLIRHAKRLLGAAGEEPALCPLLERWLAAIRMKAADDRFTDLTDLSLQAAVLIKQYDKKTYRRTILRCRDLLKKLSNEDEEILEKNLQTVAAEYPEIAPDISPGSKRKESREEEEPGIEAGSGEETGSEDREPIRYRQPYNIHMLFVGFYMSLVMSCCSLFTDLARQYMQPLFFAGGMAALLAVHVLLLLAGEKIGFLRKRLTVKTRRIFIAGIVLAVIAGICAVAGSPAAVAVSVVGTVVSGMLRDRKS